MPHALQHMVRQACWLKVSHVNRQATACIIVSLMLAGSKAHHSKLLFFVSLHDNLNCMAQQEDIGT